MKEAHHKRIIKILGSSRNLKYGMLRQGCEGFSHRSPERSDSEVSGRGGRSEAKPGAARLAPKKSTN